jgi:hypothetical protein
MLLVILQADLFPPDLNRCSVSSWSTNAMAAMYEAVKTMFLKVSATTGHYIGCRRMRAGHSAVIPFPLVVRRMQLLFLSR